MYLERLVIDNIKRIRKEKRISQEKLAEACNMATSYIGLMEIYRNVPKLSTIERIAGALKVDPLTLFQIPDSATGQAEIEKRISEKQEAALENKKKKILAVVDKQIDTILRERYSFG
jgi:transcriptional regulator with XRE-family HTH domain